VKKEYVIKKASEAAVASNGFWEEVPRAAVDCFPWDGNGYRPGVEAAVAYTEAGFHVRFKVYENFITVKYHNMNDMVCKDSCVEFFFNPKVDTDDRYLNFEVNAIGTLLLGFGKDRGDRFFVTDVTPELFKINAQLDKHSAAAFSGPSWTVEYFIPYTYLEKCYGKLDFKSGYRFEGNFYKCGDETRYAHFGCWNPIVKEKPDFHRPDFFGTLILE
jgi:hypothetical protein